METHITNKGKNIMEVEESEEESKRKYDDLDIEDGMVDPCHVIKVSKKEHEDYY